MTDETIEAVLNTMGTAQERQQWQEYKDRRSSLEQTIKEKSEALTAAVMEKIGGRGA